MWHPVRLVIPIQSCAGGCFATLHGAQEAQRNYGVDDTEKTSCTKRANFELPKSSLFFTHEKVERLCRMKGTCPQGIGVAFEPSPCHLAMGRSSASSVGLAGPAVS